MVYCHSDSASVLGVQKLTEAGFGKVYRLEGNYAAWVVEGFSVIADLSKNNSAQKGYLAAPSHSVSWGNSYILREDSKLSHLVTIIANSLSDPEDGKFYEGWLVDQDSDKFISTGKLFQTPVGEWKLEYVANQTYPEYDYVVITLETKDDGQPEEHVIEGESGVKMSLIYKLHKHARI